MSLQNHQPKVLQVNDLNLFLTTLQVSNDFNSIYILIENVLHISYFETSSATQVNDFRIRILQETIALSPCLPAVSITDYNGTDRKYTRKMEAVFPPEFTRTGNVGVQELPATGKKSENINILPDDQGNSNVSGWKRRENTT